jgi:hypothetical protein
MKYILEFGAGPVESHPLEMWRVGGADSLTMTAYAARDDEKVRRLAEHAIGSIARWIAPMRLRVGNSTAAILYIAQNTPDQQLLQRFCDSDRSPMVKFDLAEVKDIAPNAEPDATRVQLKITTIEATTHTVERDGPNLDVQPEENLRVAAARAGVPWDKKASRATMIERIRTAKSKVEPVTA